MEPLLPTQHQPDVDDLVAAKIESIYRRFPGGLGEFFERLKSERISREHNIPEPLFVGPIVQCAEFSDGND